MKEDDLLLDEAAERLSSASFEYEIAKDTRAFLKNLPKKESRRISLKPLFIAGIAASVLVVMASVITINISHNNDAIAGRYGLVRVTPRNAENEALKHYNSAIINYNEGNYEEAKAILEEKLIDDTSLNVYKDWLMLLIALRSEGEHSDAYQRYYDQISSDSNHPFYNDAQKVNNELQNFWRFLLIR